MAKAESVLKGKHILAVDDEEDILETIEDILDEARLDLARDYESASVKIKATRYDLAILDIMGVDGMKLLEETVGRGIPTVMLTAHAINPDTKTQCGGGFPSILGSALVNVNWCANGIGFVFDIRLAGIVIIFVDRTACNNPDRSSAFIQDRVAQVCKPDSLFIKSEPHYFP